MTNDELDLFARELPSMTLNDWKIPTATTRALAGRVVELLSEHVSPSPFTLNPVDGTMGYVCILAQYNGERDEWVLHDDGAHQGWVTASLVESKGDTPK